MSLVALLDAETPDPPTTAPPSATSLRDSLLPYDSVPIIHTFTVTEANQVAKVAEIQAYRNALTGADGSKFIEILVEPGFYTTSPIFTWNVITRGTTGDPADVIIAPPGERGGVLHKYEGPTWLRGLTLRSTPQAGNYGSKYPLHISGPGTLTLIDCHLDSQNTGSDGGSYVVGMDGFDGAYVTFVGCRFTSWGAGGTNMHGETKKDYGGITEAFYDCIHEAATPGDAVYGGAGETYYIGGNLPQREPLLPNFPVYTDDWPAPVGGFTNFERVSRSLDI